MAGGSGWFKLLEKIHRRGKSTGWSTRGGDWKLSDKSWIRKIRLFRGARISAMLRIRHG
jgi:hypothetical protein